LGDKILTNNKLDHSAGVASSGAVRQGLKHNYHQFYDSYTQTAVANENLYI